MITSLPALPGVVSGAKIGGGAKEHAAARDRQRQALRRPGRPRRRRVPEGRAISHSAGCP
jgi:hypothetical protein